MVPKTLNERWHLCPHCSCSMPRDQNSAKVVLLDAWTPEHTPGTGVAGVRALRFADDKVSVRVESRTGTHTISVTEYDQGN